jgi:hypothetical protein
MRQRIHYGFVGATGPTLYPKPATWSSHRKRWSAVVMRRALRHKEAVAAWFCVETFNQKV